MRLIDGDKLIKDIDYSADMGGALGKVVECTKYYAKFMVASAPTVKERKTGKWIYQTKFGRIECGVCGYVFRSYVYPRNYCPNCGAKMVQEGEQQ